MYALTRRIPEHQNMDQNVWKKRIKAAAIRLEGVMLLGSMAVVQMHATEEFKNYAWLRLCIKCTCN